MSGMYEGGDQYQGSSALLDGGLPIIPGFSHPQSEAVDSIPSNTNEAQIGLVCDYYRVEKNVCALGGCSLKLGSDGEWRRGVCSELERDSGL